MIISRIVFALMVLAFLYSTTIFIVQLVRYLKRRSSATELLDQETDELPEE